MMMLLIHSIGLFAEYEGSIHRTYFYDLPPLHITS